MSGFLTNLLRRGAGLQPIVAPRRLDLPAELPVSEQPGGEGEWEAQDVLSPSVSATPELERRSPEAASDPAPRPLAEAPRAAPVPLVEPPAAALAAPREQAAQAFAPSSPAPERSPEPAVPSSPRQDRSQEALAPPSPSPARQTAPHPAPEAVRVLAAPPVIPPPFTVSSETPVERIVASPAAPLPPAPTLPPSVPPAAAEPLLLAPIAPPPETPAALQTLDEARPPEEPRIEVRIGRIEIRQAPQPPPPTPAPRREPRGFQEHSLARRYLDRRWY